MNNSEKLLTLAKQAAQKAYCPYSHFPVGAAIEADDGNFYVGCNVENISYPNGTCAETGAIAAMVSGGGKKIVAILIYAPAPTLITPCGACRQRIAEFATSATVIYQANDNGIGKTSSIQEIIPDCFKEL